MLDKREPPAAIVKHLSRWKVILESRAEIARNDSRRWWETAWRRDASRLAQSKVIALHRTDRGRFALDEAGVWQPTKNATVVVGQASDAPVAYLCGLLNSELLDLWYAVRGKTPWHVRRDYEPKPMKEMPYRRPEGDPRADEVASLVRRIAANRRAILPQRALFPALRSTVKDPWRTHVPAIDPAALIASLPAAATVSLRLDARLSSDLGEPPYGKVVRAESGLLVLRRGHRQTGRIEGPPALLAMLAGLLSPMPPDPASVLLPKDAAAFEALVAERTATVRGLLDEGRRLVEEVERLVCGLYDAPPDLTEEVVAHAVARAARAAPADEGSAEG